MSSLLASTVHWPHFNEIRKQIKTAVKTCFSVLEPRVVYTTKDLSPANKKDILPVFQQSNVIYQFSGHCDSRYVQWRNWRGAGGNAPSWQLRWGPLIINGPPLIRLPLLSEQFYKLETFNLYKFVFCCCSSVLQSYAAQGLLNGTCIDMIDIVLYKNQL